LLKIKLTATFIVKALHLLLLYYGKRHLFMNDTKHDLVVWVSNSCFCCNWLAQHLLVSANSNHLGDD